MEVCHGAIFGRPPRTGAAYRIPPPEPSRLGARGQWIQRDWHPRLRSLRHRSGQQNPGGNGHVVLRLAEWPGSDSPDDYPCNVSSAFFLARNKVLEAGLKQLE